MPANQDNGFNRVASFYDPMARLVYGSALQDAQSWLLPFIPKNSTILVIGGGSGWLLQQLLQHTSPKHILYLEASVKMLQIAKQRNQHQTIVEFRQGTDADLHPNEQFDVVITPFILDLFPERRLAQLMQRLHAVLVSGGLWVFADFWPVQQKQLFWQMLLTKSMYLFFGFLSNVQARQLPDYESHFSALNLKEQASKPFYKCFVQAKVFKKQ